MDVVVTPQPLTPIAAGPASERSQARRETIRLLIRIKLKKWFFVQVSCILNCLLKKKN
jgi:hypothetical protein